MNNLLELNGMRVIISEHCKTVEESYKLPRSKKKRIVKKCLKDRKRYRTTETPQMYLMNNNVFNLFKTIKEETLMVHPALYSQILRECISLEDSIKFCRQTTEMFNPIIGCGS